MSDQEQGSRKTSVPAVDFPRADPRIEDYLDHVFVPLVGRVPYATRTALRSELRVHIEALIDASRELGRRPDEAVRDSLAQFGDPRVLAREWLRGWAHTWGTSSAQSAWPATVVALAWFGLATSVAMALMVASMLGADNGFMNHLGGPVVALAMPVFPGLATGLLSPGRQALGTFYALAMLIAVTTLGSEWLLAGTRFDEISTFGPVQSMFWIPIGCASAALGSWLRAHREQAPKRWVLPA